MVKKKESLIQQLRGDFAKVSLGSVILNGLFLLYGVTIYYNPLIDLTVMRVMLGIFLVILGIYQIYEFVIRDNNPLFRFSIIWGVIAVLAGLLAITNIFNINKIFTFTLGIYLVVVALDKIINSLKLRQVSYDGWALMLNIGIILLAFGLFIMINPANMEDVETASMFVILASILEVSNHILLYDKAKDIETLLKIKRKKKKTAKN